MQFRDQGNRTQVLAYRGYDKEKKRAIVKLIGSYDKITLEVPSELISALTDNEQEELNSYILPLKKAYESSVKLNELKNLPAHINSLSDTVIKNNPDIVSEQYALDLYLSINQLTKTLRKLGYKRPPRYTRVQSVT